MSAQESIPDEPRYEPLPAGQLASSALATIEELHQAFLKSAQNEMAELMQESVTMSFQGAKQTPIAASMRGTRNGDRAIELDLAPLGASAYIVFPPARYSAGHSTRGAGRGRNRKAPHGNGKRAFHPAGIFRSIREGHAFGLGTGLSGGVRSE